MGSFRSGYSLLLQVARLGVRHPRIWSLVPLAMVAAGVFGFDRLAHHYEWGRGTAVFIGLLLLALFVVIVGPLTLLPSILASRAREINELEGVSADLLEHARRTGSVSTR